MKKIDYEKKKGTTPYIHYDIKKKIGKKTYYKAEITNNAGTHSIWIEKDTSKKIITRNEDNKTKKCFMCNKKVTNELINKDGKYFCSNDCEAEYWHKNVSNVRVEIEKKDNGDYKLYLIGAKSPVVMFSGGHATLEEDELLVTSRMYKRFDNVSKKLLIEEGNFEDFEYNVWYYIHILNKDKTIKYYFTLKKMILEPIEGEMVVQDKDYIIKNIFQSKLKIFPKAKDLFKESDIKKVFREYEELTVRFWLEGKHEFIIVNDKDQSIITDKKNETKKIMNAIVDIAKQINIENWITKVYKYPRKS